jgi:putative hydrolase of the HAD superfamily
MFRLAQIQIRDMGDVANAEKVMERLGMAHHFEAMFDREAGYYWPKPHRHDIAVNLRPAADMGMRTVWVHTEKSVKRAASTDLSHIHHQTDDLATWLAKWVAQRRAS